MPVTQLDLCRGPRLTNRANLGHVFVHMSEGRIETVPLSHDLGPRSERIRPFADFQRGGGRQQAIGEWESSIVMLSEDGIEFEMFRIRIIYTENR